MHTFIRPVAGALLMASSEASGRTIVLGTIGALLALPAHGAKASTRLLARRRAPPDLNRARVAVRGR